MSETILVTGASGLTGFHVARRLGTEAPVVALFFSRAPEMPGLEWRRCDLRNETETTALLDALRPAAIIHCAALSDTSYCERHAEEAASVNHHATAALAQWAARWGGYLVHVSTDLVFDGQGSHYTEDAGRAPISEYGRSKVAAEDAVEASGAAHCIVRTSIIYGRSPFGVHSADEKLREVWDQGHSTRLFTDEFRCPTPVGMLAEMLGEICRRRLTGRLHVAGPERVSRYTFGAQIARLLGYPENLVLPARVKDVAAHPPRARDVSLDISKARGLLVTPFVSLEEGLRCELGLPGANE